MDSFLTLPLDSGAAIAFVKLQLEQSGFHVSLAFDIDSSCASFADDVCPHTHEKECRCELTILQISNRKLHTLPLMLHSLDRETELSIPDPQLLDSPELAHSVQAALASKEPIGDFNLS
ncbi:MAG: hypothetical protein DWQ07_18450 [Chloroflexi bacterium]|nr:MAG: hypothetical protein DWQ07_18450 [Chloroflexota bacterium]